MSHPARRWARKERRMSRHTRPTRRLGLIAGAGGAVILAALIVVAVAFASTAKPTAVKTAVAGHKCLVLAGSGDPAFVRNFNPFTSTSTPGGALSKGALYEPLIITTVAGGGHTYPWLAQSWKWSNG